MSESPQVDSQSFAKRTPIIDQERSQEYKIDDLDRQWGLVTETIKRELFPNPTARKALVGFVTSPLDEALPSNFLSTISASDERFSRINSRYKDSLGAFLTLPSIPDELLIPDLRTAPYIQPMPFNPSSPTHGISNEERAMAVRRYRYARDVKLLALGAEMVEVGRDNLQPQAKNGVTEYVLPSGVRIGVVTKNQQTATDVLSPELWEKRKQIKDRVYEVTINGKRYILKERKTPRHWDTLKHGHRDGLTSEEELKVARRLQDSTVKGDGIALKWEVPVGFAEFPDGFQFAIFEFTDDLKSERNVYNMLTWAVSANEPKFTDEYEMVRRSYKQLLQHPQAIWREEFLGRRKKEPSPLKRLFRLPTRSSGPKTPELRFIDYAVVKAYRMIEVADFLQKLTLARAGYRASDQAVAEKVKFEGNDLLEVHTYDYEYFDPLSPEEVTPAVGRSVELLHDGEKRGLYDIVGLDLLDANHGRLVPEILPEHEAAYQALIALEANKWADAAGETQAE